MPPKKTNSKPAPTVAKAKRRQTFSNVAQLDVNNPVPIAIGGAAFSYITGTKYIPFLNPKDDFFKTLLEAKTLSLTHNACIETKKDYCAGQGLYDINNKEFSADVLKWLKRMNNRNDSATGINRKAFGSLFTFGNIPIEVVRLTVGSTPFIYVHVHNVLEWRLKWPDDNGDVTAAIQSKLFLRDGVQSPSMLKDARVIPLFNPATPNSKKNWTKEEGGVQRTMFWLKNDFDGYEHYGMPSAVSSLIYQVLEYKGARFNLDNFENNLVLGGILALKGNVDQDEADRIGRNILKTHTGDGKRGRIMAVASEEGIAGSDFHQFATNKDGSFIEFDKAIADKIIMANQWDAMLAGTAHQSTGGRGNTYLRTLFEIKKKTVIDPAQTFLIDNFWIHLQGIAREWMGLDFDTNELGIKDINPISLLADVDPTPAVKVNEVREAIGLEKDPSPKGEQYLGEIKANQKAKADATGGAQDNVQD